MLLSDASPPAINVPLLYDLLPLGWDDDCHVSQESRAAGL